MKYWIDNAQFVQEAPKPRRGTQHTRAQAFAPSRAPSRIVRGGSQLPQLTFNKHSLGTRPITNSEAALLKAYQAVYPPEYVHKVKKTIQAGLWDGAEVQVHGQTHQIMPLVLPTSEEAARGKTVRLRV